MSVASGIRSVKQLAIPLLALAIMAGCNPQEPEPAATPSQQEAQAITPVAFILPPPEAPSVKPPKVDRLMSRVIYAKCFARPQWTAIHDEAKAGTVIAFEWNGVDKYVVLFGSPMLVGCTAELYGMESQTLILLNYQGNYLSAGHGVVRERLDYEVYMVGKILMGTGGVELSLRFSETMP